VADTLVRVGVRHLLSQCPSVSAVLDVPAGASALQAVRSIRPDVLVLGMGSSAGRWLPLLVEAGGLTQVIALCSSRDPMLAALAARRTVARVLVHGEFTKDDFVRSVASVASRRLAGQAPGPRGTAAARERASASRASASRPAASRGSASPAGFPAAGSIAPAGSRLSAREEDVMRCIAKGMRNTEIAAALTLTQKTVKNHINRIFAKLGVETRTQALLTWMEVAA
jgi:DNA-binding NarL/FixJ family response regulator